MLDLFVIFSKGGIVFWCFQGANLAIAQPVNALIKSVILQERGGGSAFNYEKLNLQYKLDNEFELVFVVGYQNILQLSYIDRLLEDMQRAFRERFRAVLENGTYNHRFDFDDVFRATLKQCEDDDRERAQQKKQMRKFDQTEKYTKSKEGSKNDPLVNKQAVKPQETKAEDAVTNGEDKLLKGREKLATMAKRGDRPGARQRRQNKPVKESETKKTTIPDKRLKVARVWDNGGRTSDIATLDHSSDGQEQYMNGETQEKASGSAGNDADGMVGSMKGELQSVGSVESSGEEEEEEEEEEDGEETVGATGTKGGADSSGKGIAGGIFSFFKGLAGGKTLTKQDVDPILEKMKEHLIAKNVATDIADQLCSSVATKLEGKVLGTFSGVTSTVKASLHESLMQILSPRRRVDILRDVMESKKKGNPYVITFCGVNGVGKSTNLAKICFWLLDNGHRVLVSACDTFRAGAVEQLRTHQRSLAAMHKPENEEDPPRVVLYEKGYGKDAASIAMDSVRYAKEAGFDVVLVDTAGRMQDNEPLMRALAKLIKVNAPDLVLFVGEALVGNEAVDQLKKFNRALADHSHEQNPRLIDGILLTKFDTIDDKVGAAISMTYTTGQPIVFVGTGQTYTDLRSLNPKAVVNALLKA